MALLLTTALAAQPSTDVLRVNRLHVRLKSDGQICDSAGSAAVVDNKGMNLLQNCSVWMSATDSAANLRTAAHHTFLNLHEFWSGPLELANEIPAPQPAWNKVYSVSADQVIYHRDHYRDAGYTQASQIANWPGSGTAPFARILAPFVDVEVNDRVYEPAKGDYPYFVSDAVMYSISNDRYAGHTYTGGLPLGVELHTSVAGFKGDTLLDRLVLVRFSVFNRSNRNYADFRLSPVLNFRIGTVDNEYLGTEVTTKTLYAVNDTSEATFSGRLLSFGCMALNRNLSSTMYFENTPDPINGLPDSAVHFHNLMQGKWKNGKWLNYGSNGVDGSGSARFVYPDTTDVTAGGSRWIDQVPGKKVGLMNFEPVPLPAGSALSYEIALFSVESNKYNFKQIGLECLKILTALNDRNVLKTPSFTEKNKGVLKLYPNPVRAGEKLRIETSLEGLLRMRLIDGHGREIDNLNLDVNDKSIILPPDLNQGVYMLEIKTLNTVWYGKLILNH